MDDSHLGCAVKLQSRCKLRLQSREGLTRTGGSVSMMTHLICVKLVLAASKKPQFITKREQVTSRSVFYDLTSESHTPFPQFPIGYKGHHYLIW